MLGQKSGVREALRGWRLEAGGQKAEGKMFS